ncbi:MAG TPA: DUF2809 domain-containing protein [Microbacterium sp.]|nr:DUF2809 domain-containing protein [Microbacterium sp.]
MPTPLRRRLAAVLLAAATVCAGLFVHVALPDGFETDAAGDILYAVLIYLLVVILGPRLRPLFAAAVAFAWCAAVELFQLTGLPEIWGTAFRPLTLVFGTVFTTTDLVMYLAGVAFAFAVDAVWTALARSRGEHEAGTIVTPVDAEESP